MRSLRRLCQPVSIYDPLTKNAMIKLLLLLYPEDTTIILRHLCRIQHGLVRWKLTINSSKAKILMFGREKRQYTIHLNGEILEKIKVFKYLALYSQKMAVTLLPRKITSPKPHIVLQNDREI